MDDPEFAALLQELLRIPQLQGDRKNEESVQENIEGLKRDLKGPGRECLKCDTFAELQERLGCIDGSETTTDVLKSSSKGPPVNNAAAEPPRQKGRCKKTSPETQQASLSRGFACSQASFAEKQTDGAFPGDSFQREDSGLYDCEECSATSSSEELLNQTLSLNMTYNSELPKHESLKSNSQDLDVNSQGMVVNSSLPHQHTPKQESPEAAYWFKADKRTSPVGKSSSISPSSSCSASRSLATSVIIGDTLPDRPTEDEKEMKATITVTVQQPLDLKGQDELVFSMVEEVTISGAMKRGRTGGNIICIREDAQSYECVQAPVSPQPIRIISNVSDEPGPAGSSNTNKSSVVESAAEKTYAEQPQCQSRREKRFVPSFINPMLMNTATDCQLDETKGKESTLTPMSELGANNAKCPEDRKVVEKKKGAAAKCDKLSDSPFSQTPYDPMILGDFRFSNKTAESKVCGKRPSATDNGHPRDGDHVYSTKPPRVSEEGAISSRPVGNNPKRIGVAPGCHKTTYASIHTGSLPRVWQPANHQDSYHGDYMADGHRDPRGMTSSTPCSPDITLKRRQGRQHSPANHSPLVSSSRKHGTEYKQHANRSTHRKGAESLFGTSSRRMNNVSGNMKSLTEDSSVLFSAKLEQLATLSNSLGRTPRDFATLNRDSSSTSMSSKGSSNGSAEGACKGGYKGRSEGDYTLPRASKSPRKNRSDQGHHFLPYEEQRTYCGRHTPAKLSAVGKLKLACGPKVRRLSAPSIKNLSLPHKSLRQAVNRSASLSPDSKTVSFERTSSFLSSSPPRSFRSISRTPSQSSTCSSTKSVIQGVVNGSFSDLLKERLTSPTSVLDPLAVLPSPYSRVTAPRIPDRTSAHASDTTSVLSGDLPPAMGKTSLYFSSRNSMVSSGYDSMVRDSEATGSSNSTRGSVSDRSGSLLSVVRSSRSSRRRGNAGKTPGKWA